MKFILIVFLALTLNAKPEREYQKEFCDSIGGKTEVVLSDRTRVDCLTDKYAIEVDFGRKWAESIGQSLHYGLMTNRKAGVYLIMRNKRDFIYLERLERIAEKHNIEVFYDENFIKFDVRD